MRSDTEEIPGGFTKEEADRAETQEAAERDAASNASTPGQRTRRAAEPINCRTYWPSPFKVCGAIRDKYDAIGGPTSFLLFPRSDELGVPDGVGRRNEFVNGFIYWHPDTGAHPITTHFSTVWARTGWEAGRLGYPTTDEFVLPDGVGRKQSFQRGHIYGSLAGLASIEGLIYDKWVALGAENSELGYPIIDESGTPDGVGRFNHFQGGSIYWTPSNGAFEIEGTTLFLWSLSGFERGKYGYPRSQEYLNSSGSVVQDFDKGTIDITRSLQDAPLISFAGKKVNKIVMDMLIDYANKNGFDLESVLQAPSVQMRSGGSSLGGVTIPSEYVYDPSKGTLHDYCTSSFDQFPSPGVNADFRGACARHDLCYEKATSDGRAVLCNRAFKDDLMRVCKNVYTAFDPRRTACGATARGYYDAVVVRHPSQWGGHIVI